MSDPEATLAALCDAFVPAADGLPAASALGVPARIRAEVAALGRPAFVAQLGQLLTLIDSPIANLALAGRPVRFSALPQDEREAYLKRFATSPLPLLRTAFQDLKRLVLLYTYGMEDSPYRRLAGYRPPVLDAPAPRAGLRARVPAPGEVIEADVCVIGSGAGGGVAAAELARAGKRVVVLERARLVEEDGFAGRELEGQAALLLDRGLTATDDRAIAVRAGSAVGGGTIVNWSTSLRLPPAVREEWRAAGIADDLDEDYESVEATCDVDADESERNGPNAALERGLRALGYRHETIRRNVYGCGDCGPCALGCRRGAKRSTLRTYLADACGSGAEILHSCEARRVVVRGGRVDSVVARVAGGEVTVRAPLVALAGGAILSPALLLRSGIAGERAGRDLHIHPVAVVGGNYADRLEAWSGVPQSVLSDEFAELRGAYGFRIECAPAHPGLLASGFPWWGSAMHRRYMSLASSAAPLLGIVRDREAGRVVVDRRGEAVMRYWPGAQERELLVTAMVKLAAIHDAAGAKVVFTLHTPPVIREGEGRDSFAARIERAGVLPNRVLLFSAHQMGSCRIGTSRRESVADPDGQVWGVRGLYVTDASAFPSASGVNPMLTIMALARRTARRMLA